MVNEVNGTVVSVSTQWWMKINTKAARLMGTDGAVYPHIVKVKYTVDGKDYIKRKWLGAGVPAPCVGSTVAVTFCTEKPSKAKVVQ